MTFHVTLATPDKVFFDGAATEAVCPGLRGFFGILARHTRMMTAMKTGILKIRGESQEQYFLVEGGMVEVANDRIELLADFVTPATSAADAEVKLDELKAKLPNPAA